MMQLTGQQLGFAYGDRMALQGIDLQVQRGEIVGLIGPNGAGKSTLLRLLGGLLRGSGAVTYDGHPTQTYSPRALAALRAFVSQGSGDRFLLRVGDVVALGAAHRHRLFAGRTPGAAVEAALAAVGCEVGPDRLFSELSGGERQQVCLARAFLQAAPLLLLDEPTSFLDLRHQHSLATALTSHAQAGGMVVVSLHDLNMAALLCHRLVLLHTGRVVALGAPRDVLQAPELDAVYRTPLRRLGSPHGEFWVQLDLHEKLEAENQRPD